MTQRANIYESRLLRSASSRNRRQYSQSGLIALLAHIGLVVEYPVIWSCKHKVNCRKAAREGGLGHAHLSVYSRHFHNKIFLKFYKKDLKVT